MLAMSGGGAYDFDKHCQRAAHTRFVSFEKVPRPMTDKISEGEWLACEDSAWMLKSLLEAATEQQLRLFACACCRRIWDKYPMDWAEREFASYGPGYESTIRYVYPRDWADPRPRAAVEVAEAFCRGEASSAELQRAHERAQEFASYMWGRWEWANYRLGDAGHFAEYGVGAVTAQTADAARDASDPDIRKSVIHCAKQAASAIGFHVSEAKQSEAIRVEQKSQAQMIREIFPWQR
jgi:hypothetical protein